MQTTQIERAHLKFLIRKGSTLDTRYRNDPDLGVQLPLKSSYTGTDFVRKLETLEKRYGVEAGYATRGGSFSSTNQGYITFYKRIRSDRITFKDKERMLYIVAHAIKLFRDSIDAEELLRSIGKRKG